MMVGGGAVLRSRCFEVSMVLWFVLHNEDGRDDDGVGCEFRVPAQEHEFGRCTNRRDQDFSKFKNTK